MNTKPTAIRAAIPTGPIVPAAATQGVRVWVVVSMPTIMHLLARGKVKTPEARKVADPAVSR